jgi:hypothetical protein
VGAGEWVRLGREDLLRIGSARASASTSVGGGQWLRSTEEDMCEIAGCNGHLEVLQWARANRYP